MDTDAPWAEISVLRVDAEGRRTEEADVVARETVVRLVSNGRELAMCSISPGMEKEFTYGHLFSHGAIGAASEVSDWTCCGSEGERRVTVRLKANTTRGCVPPAPLCGPFPGISVSTILGASEFLQANAGLFRRTGGVHAAALWGADGTPQVLVEDIGRHNAFDKLVGFCLLHPEIDIRQCFVMCAGRLPGEIVWKAWRLGVPLLASRSAPTSRGIELARQANMALVGFARGSRFNVYGGSERVLEDAHRG
ncbi:MAG: formate dehydrogenase accessory sulfurtransferase FdhD [Kiritimatiellae bacterium]|nr:formate dehydrogenase accessory sulfurtransferase FdhD [Kiritimatiellia bacterium]